MTESDQSSSLPITMKKNVDDNKEIESFVLKSMDHIEQYISLQGSIGSGKTTFMKYTEEFLHEHRLDATVDEYIEEDKPDKIYILTVDEPVGEWTCPFDPITGESMLGLYYKYINEPVLSILYGIRFQMLAKASRLNRLRSRLSLIARPDLKRRIFIISERSPISDKTFFRTVVEANGDSMQIDWKIYMMHYNLCCPDINRRESKMIYLPTSPPVCYARLQRRARLEEVENNISDAYLSQLDRSHEKMINEFIETKGEDAVIRLDVFNREMTTSEIRTITYDVITKLVQ